MLTNIFLHDIQLPHGATSLSLRVDIFVWKILPNLETILIDGDSSVIKTHIFIFAALNLLLSEFLKGEYGCREN